MVKLQFPFHRSILVMSPLWVPTHVMYTIWVVPGPEKLFERAFYWANVTLSLCRPFQPTCSTNAVLLWSISVFVRFCWFDRGMEFSMSIRMSVSGISHHFDHCCFCILNQLGLDTKWWPNTVTKIVCCKIKVPNIKTMKCFFNFINNIK